MARALHWLCLALCLASVYAETDRVWETHDRIEKMMMQSFGGPVAPYDLVIRNIEMRDGVTLRTRIWVPRNLPAGETRSAIYDRTPYGPAYTAMSMIWAIDGYVIVMQDQRGTFGSGGEFEVWRMDGQDAMDTCEYIAAQEWSNGKVFAWGVSADANSVYPIILYNNPWIKAQFPVLGADNGYDLVYPQGAYRQDLIERWLDSVCTECIQEVKENEAYGAYWEPINMTSHYDNIHFPSVHWAGWWDIFLQPQINAFNGYYKKGAYGKDTFLLVDPHGHCYDVVYPAGVSLLGLKLARAIFHEQTTGERWAILDEVNPINFWVFGPQDGVIGPGNYYTSLTEWPTAEPTNYFLREDGSLTGTNQVAEGVLTYSHDPNDPIPFYGGHNLFGTCGPLDQSSIENRADVITFTTDPLVRDLTIVGEISAFLHVSSDANDTDFIVKVTDVYPDGRSLLVTEGVIRMRWRDSIYTPVNMVPGTVYQVEVKLWSTAIVFARQHQIRVDVMSSLNPRWSNNPNNGNWLVEEGPMIVARNRIHVGGSYSTRVVLPVVDESQIPEFDVSRF